MLRLGLAFLLAALAPAPVVAETFQAPLPPGYAASGEASVQGLYAEVTGLSSIYDEETLAALADSCAAKGKTVATEGAENRSRGAARIYRSRRAVAVVVDEVRLTADAEACVARYVMDRRVTLKSGNWKPGGVPYFRDPDLRCAARRVVRRCSQVTVAGIPVTCINDGDGFVGSVSCVSLAQDLSRGLLVASSTYVDDGSMPTGEWSLDTVVLDAAIDPVVFRDPAARSGQTNE